MINAPSAQYQTIQMAGSMGEAMTFHPSLHTTGFYEGGIVDDSRVLDRLPNGILQL
jgi:hypothetical protein